MFFQSGAAAPTDIAAECRQTDLEIISQRQTLSLKTVLRLSSVLNQLVLQNYKEEQGRRGEMLRIAWLMTILAASRASQGQGDQLKVQKPNLKKAPGTYLLFSPVLCKEASTVFIFDILCLDDAITQEPGLVSFVNASDEGGKLRS